MSARKRTSNSASGGGLGAFEICTIIIVIILVSLIKAIGFLTFSGLICLIAWLYFENESRTDGSLVLSDKKEFDLTLEEKVSIKQYATAISQLSFNQDQQEIKRDELICRLNQLFEDGDTQGIRRRSDDLFDTRSSKGKSLNDKIEELSNNISALNHDTNNIKSEIKNIRTKSDLVNSEPEKRYQKYLNYVWMWKFINTSKIVSRVAVLVYLVVFIVIKLSN